MIMSHQIFKKLLIILSCIFIPLLGFAQVQHVQVQMNIPLSFIRQLTYQSLEFDDKGKANMDQDECNQAVLENPKLWIEQDFIHLNADIQAVIGVAVLGACRQTSPFNGQLHILLQAKAQAAMPAIIFEPVSAELSSDGKTQSLFNSLLKLLAEHKILPPLRAIRIDIAQALHDLDLTLEYWLPNIDANTPGLVERSRLGQIDIGREGIQAQLVFSVNAFNQTVKEPPLDRSELVAWQSVEDELDGFVTHIVLYLIEANEDSNQREELLDILLDTRYNIANVLAGQTDDVSLSIDPVRGLFIDSWDRLRPYLQQLPSTKNDKTTMFQLLGFLAGGDALKALDNLGPEYGIEITRDGLRRMARMLLGNDAPASFTPLPLDINPALRKYLDLEPVPDQLLHDPGSSPDQIPLNPETGSLDPGWLDFILTPVFAQQGSFRGLVEDSKDLDTYIAQAQAFIDQQTKRLIDESTKIPAGQTDDFRVLVKATAWKESCWRQYTGSPDKPELLTSSAGAVGMMQINPRVWRGIYDIEKLSTNLAYNIFTGAQILEHYLVDYALRKGEDRLGDAYSATYAAYNGGPGHLSRYRKAETPERLKLIDNAFIKAFQQIKKRGRPELNSCFGV